MSNAQVFLTTFISRFFKGKRPKTLTIEPTNYCNLNCPFCLVGLQDYLPSCEHRSLPRKLGFMDFKLFEKIVADAVSFGTEIIQLHFQGEPLLHNNFTGMVKVVKQADLRTKVFTNGLLLNEQLAAQLIKSGLDEIQFSIDGASQETYQKNRKGGSFATAYNNMKMLASMAKGTQLKVKWQFIVLANNEHELALAQNKANGLGIELCVKTFAVTIPELAPLNANYRRKLRKKPCTDIYRNIFIFWNGDVVCCCYDLAGKYVMGNLRNNTLSQIWNSQKYRQLRREIDRAKKAPDKEPSICKSCLKWGT